MSEKPKIALLDLATNNRPFTRNFHSWLCSYLECISERRKKSEPTIEELVNQMVDMGLAMTMEELITDIPANQNAAPIYEEVFELSNPKQPMMKITLRR